MQVFNFNLLSRVSLLVLFGCDTDESMLALLDTRVADVCRVETVGWIGSMMFTPGTLLDDWTLKMGDMWKLRCFTSVIYCLLILQLSLHQHHCALPSERKAGIGSIA